MLLSIIIITYNERNNIEVTINSVKKSAKIGSNYSIPIEIIVSDGGSNDGTFEIAKNLADLVIQSKRGRYIQLNNGAEASKGDILVFLHADTFLPEGGLVRLLKIMQNPCIIGGGFKKEWKWSEDVELTSFMKFVLLIWKGFGNWIVRLIKSK